MTTESRDQGREERLRKLAHQITGLNILDPWIDAENTVLPLLRAHDDAVRAEAKQEWWRESWHPDPKWLRSAGVIPTQRYNACSHPKRLTSAHRRMYCGDCDVSFVQCGPDPAAEAGKREAEQRARKAEEKARPHGFMCKWALAETVKAQEALSYEKTITARVGASFDELRAQRNALEAEVAQLKAEAGGWARQAGEAAAERDELHEKLSDALGSGVSVALGIEHHPLCTPETLCCRCRMEVAQRRVEELEKALREIAMATADIPELNCKLAYRMAMDALAQGTEPKPEPEEKP